MVVWTESNEERAYRQLVERLRTPRRTLGGMLLVGISLLPRALGHPLKRYFTGIAPPVSSEREIA